ncbi:hypothetical protein AR687_22440 [Flavobacteriaceae bacterium CRH]|nr:hypothetical protein AR687_22440 [Flavobacteriaceae bacterium CRH]
MKEIFKTPIILNGENDNVVLIYSKYIIGNISKEIARLCIERIDADSLEDKRFECIIRIKEVFKYKFKPEHDSQIKFGVKNVTGTSYVMINFKDKEVAKQAEISFMEQFEKLGFKRKEEQVSPVKAATFPLLFTLMVSVAGGLLTRFAYRLEGYELTRSAIVNGYVYMLEKVLKFVGCYPVLILTFLSLVLCLFWTLKKMSNIPFRIISKK